MGVYHGAGHDCPDPALVRQMVTWLWIWAARIIAPLVLIGGALLGLRVKWGRDGAKRERERHVEADKTRAQNVRERAQVARDADGLGNADPDQRLRQHGRLRD